MAGVVTNKGAAVLSKLAVQDAASPVKFYIALTTNNAVKDTNTLSQLTQIAAQYGYQDGGYLINRTDGITVVEDDANDRAVITFPNIQIAAVNGAIPYPSFAVLTGDGDVIADREVLATWDLSTGVEIEDGTTLTLVGLSLRVS